MSTRISHRSSWTTIGENLAYNSWTGFGNIVSFVVDDGVPSRGHRWNIYQGYNNPSTLFTHSGIFCTCMNQDYENSNAYRYETYCCINYGAALSAVNYTNADDVLDWMPGNRDSAACAN